MLAVVVVSVVILWSDIPPAAATAALPSTSQWIHESTREYYTTAAQIVIDGTGIDCGPVAGGTMASCLDAAFLPALTLNMDYMVDTSGTSATKITLTLIQGKKWRATPGPLYLQKIRNGDAYTLTLD